MSVRVVLTEEQRGAVGRGRFVRVAAAGESLLVGRVAGRWRAYVNECRHRALPLDLGAESPMSDDGRFLLCHQHGALYRLSDGACVAGPCAGASLTPRDIAESGGALLLGEGPVAITASTPRFPYVVVDVAADLVDEAGALLFELGAAGVEQRDESTLARASGDRVTLLASFAAHDEARAAVAELPAAWSPRVEEVVGDAWRDEWKKHFEPFVLAPGIVVSPPWHEDALVEPRRRAAQPEHGARVLILEPGRAFGTGLHETTRLVAQALVDHAPLLRNRPVLDVGCGSGILSLVALALGASEARAIDVDPEAVLATRENAARNGLGDRVRADDTPAEALTARYPVVVANIEAAPLIALAPALIARMAGGGALLVLSGVLAPEARPGQLDEVRRAFGALEENELRRQGEWVALLLRRRG